MSLETALRPAFRRALDSDGELWSSVDANAAALGGAALSATAPHVAHSHHTCFLPALLFRHAGLAHKRLARDVEAQAMAGNACCRCCIIRWIAWVVASTITVAVLMQNSLRTEASPLIANHPAGSSPTIRTTAAELTSPSSPRAESPPPTAPSAYLLHVQCKQLGNTTGCPPPATQKSGSRLEQRRW
eukprot:2580472-Prymnesium_polylepis.1